MNFGYHDEVYLPLAVEVSDAYSASELTINASGRVLGLGEGKPECPPNRAGLFGWDKVSYQALVAGLIFSSDDRGLIHAIKIE